MRLRLNKELFGFLLLKAIAFCGLLVVLLTACQPKLVAVAPGKSRKVENNTLVSTYDPIVRIKVDSSLKYQGRFSFTIKADTVEYEKNLWYQDIAAGERFVFAEIDKANKAKKLFIVQLEGFLPNNAMTYNYNFRNAIFIGGLGFRQNSMIYNDAELAKERPNNEAAKTRQFLISKGVTLPDEFFMNRFVTVTDSTRRSEMILYYVEDAGSWGLNAQQFGRNEYSRDLIDSAIVRLRTNANKSFQILAN